VCLTEEQVRAIVREEMKAMLTSLELEANRADGYETGELESSALQAIRKVADAAHEVVDHKLDCASRSDRYRRCDCGVRTY